MHTDKEIRYTRVKEPKPRRRARSPKLSGITVSLYRVEDHYEAHRDDAKILVQSFDLPVSARAELTVCFEAAQLEAVLEKLIFVDGHRVAVY